MEKLSLKLITKTKIRHKNSSQKCVTKICHKNSSQNLSQKFVTKICHKNSSQKKLLQGTNTLGKSPMKNWTPIWVLRSSARPLAGGELRIIQVLKVTTFLALMTEIKKTNLSS